MNTYQSFDLMLAADDEAGQYQVRVLASPSGQGVVRVAWPAALMTAQGEPPLPFPTAASAARTFGEALYKAIFQGEVATVWQRSLAVVEAANSGLRIRLRLDEVPELAMLPWEYLFDADRNRFLCLTDATPIVRYLALPQPEPALHSTAPLRILVVTAAATDVPQLDIAGEAARVQEALQPLETQGKATVTWLENGTLRNLRTVLRQGQYQILHFIGHGWFDGDTDSYGLLFVDEAGAGQWVTADELSMTLQNHRALRLIFLNACEGARQAAGEPFGGVAQQLVQQGLPAVIAMQYPVSDDAAIELSREFYSALADNYPVEAALAQARLAIYRGNGEAEWGTPVLFMRAGDGRLWQNGQAAEAMEETMGKSQGSTSINTGGGAFIGGNVQAGGDFIGRDKVVHGDEVKGDKVQGDKVQGHKANGDVIVATVGAGAGNVAIGKGNTQYNLGAPTADDKAQIEAQLAQVMAAFAQLQPQLDGGQAPMIQFQLQLLQGELTKTGESEAPSASTVIQVGDWLLDNVAALVPVLRMLFTLPAVTKVLAKAGPTAVAWQQRRF